ncbi:MAG: AI-2E family transporter, partial [Verrucomicrobia bacterium]|nr:AI-2E family transporter [Verrucomicrobiota bacterium]
VAGMRAAAPIVVPFLLAAFISIMCAPLLIFLQKRRFPTPLAVLVVVVVILAAALTVGAFVGTSLTDFLSKVPSYQNGLRNKTVELINWLQSKGFNTSADVMLDYFDPTVAFQMVGTTLSSLTGVLTNAFMILITIIFIMLEASSMPAKIRAALGDPDASLSSYAGFFESVNKYLAIKSIISLITGFCATVLLLILGVDYPILWGLVAFLLNYVPNIGSIIAAIPPTLVALIQYGPGKSLVVLTAYIVINAVFGSFIEPRIMGRGLGLSTLVVFLSLVFWGWVLGPIGMLLSVPLTMIVKIALESSDETRWLAILLGSEKSAPQPE